jgi:hypothetical protein
MDYMEEHRDDFEPFMEDEEKFDHVRGDRRSQTQS